MTNQKIELEDSVGFKITCLKCGQEVKLERKVENFCIRFKEKEINLRATYDGIKSVECSNCSNEIGEDW